ncbi:glycoside hydrolase family 9 protein, partial [Bacteroidota bacterium]
DIFNHVVDSLMQFFMVQRCGYTNPFLHDICHRADATELIENGNRIKKRADLTGGWHDAGDYVKFLNTTAYTTYTLLFAYDFDPQKFEFDNNNNFVPDVLEEAKIGLDWLLKCNYEKYKLVTQVQDLRDHEQGFRLPENDKLEYDRPAFAGRGKNIIGIYVAAMSLASRIWADRFCDREFADKCLTAAENLYSIRGMVPDVDSSGSGMYLDGSYEGKLALGAVELYLTTNRKIILDEAVKMADEAGSEYWWSWGNIAPYAHYRLAKINKRFGDYIKNNLVVFNANKDSTLFNEGTALTWGSNNTLLGIALQNILWKDLNDNSDFDTLGVYQRDFVLGRNQWGVCFMNNIGTEFSRNLHHQVAFLTNGNLPGGFAAGPVPRELLEQYKIPFKDRDRFRNFQTDDAVYRDDPMDYVTNEPTISANATAIFVMGFYSKR